MAAISVIVIPGIVITRHYNSYIPNYFSRPDYELPCVSFVSGFDVPLDTKPNIPAGTAVSKGLCHLPPLTVNE